MLLNNLISKDIYLISPLLILFLGAVSVLFLGFVKKKSNLSKWLVTSLSVLTIVTSWMTSYKVFDFLKGAESFLFENALIISPFSFWVGSAVFFSAFFSALLFNQSSFLEEKQYANFMFLFLSSLLGVLSVLYSNNLLVLFVSAELVALPVYMMILLTREKTHSKESAFKYYVLGSIASAFFLLGAVLVFGSSSAQFGDEVFLNILKLKEVSSELIKIDHLFLVGSTFMLLAALLKVGVFPFHNWIPDVYQGANSAVTYYLVTVSKISALLVLLKLMMSGFLIHADFFQLAFQWIVVLSMVFGALFAFHQTSVKRIFAYSGITHSGYMIMSFMGFGYDGVGGVDAFVFYLFPYVFFSSLIFYVLQSLEKEKGHEVTLFDLKGLSKKWPVESLILLVGVFGVSGMPPFIGFVTKFYVLKTSVQTGFYWVSFWSLVASAIGMVYYLKIISKVYFDDFDDDQYVLWSGVLKKRASSKKKVAAFSVIILASTSLIYYFPLNS